MRGNALLNRLRSHRAATILYRTSSQPERERVSRPLAPVGATAAAKRPVVMARLIPTGSSLPFGQVIAPERVSPAIQRETEQIFPVESFERGDFASPRRVPYQQQPTLPSTEIEPKAADIPAAPTPELPQVKPPQPPVPSRAAAPEMPGGQTSSDAPSVQEEPSPTAKPKPKVTPPPGASEDFSWISDGEWNRLKRFMG